MSKLLIIDDDIELCEMLTEYLGLEGYEVVSAHSGPEGSAMVGEQQVDVVILDVMLPGMPGFEVLKNIRSFSLVPVIMLTARGDDIDRILGLEMGADDYLPKPFNPRELVARLRAVLRRSEIARSADKANLEVGKLQLKPRLRKAYFDGEELSLTSTEYAILGLLAESAGEIVNKDTLYEKALGRKIAAFDRSIDMHISHLRRKIPGGDNLIVTVRGTGYQLIKDS